MFIIDFKRPQEDLLKDISSHSVPAWAIPIFDFINSWMDSGTASFPVMTSGSTGAPKEIYHSREAMTASAVRTCDFFGLKPGNIALLALPATHIGGKMMIARSIVRKLQLICVEPKSNPLIDQDFEQELAFASFTPMQMSMILSQKASSDKVSNIKKIILGGGEVSQTLKEKLQHISPSVYETYGMTETISHIALKKLNGPDHSDYFTLLDGVEITLDDRNCLVISAPHLSPETIITNDIVDIINEKQFRWLGRYDNIINTGGIKVFAEEIERKLQPYIKENFFITGLPDNILGQKVTLVIESKQAEKAISGNYTEALDKFEKPKQILGLEKFAYTENGKINKRETIKNLS